jgi:hypothetical protein
MEVCRFCPRVIERVVLARRNRGIERTLHKRRVIGTVSFFSTPHGMIRENIPCLAREQTQEPAHSLAKRVWLKSVSAQIGRSDQGSPVLSAVVSKIGNGRVEYKSRETITNFCSEKKKAISREAIKG